MRKHLALMILLALLAAACAEFPDEAGSPWCDDFGVLMLAAQSVPEAQLVPCVDLTPVGWSVSKSHIDSEGTEFSLHSAIAGLEAAHVRLQESCDIEDFVQVPTDESETERYEFVSRVEGGFEGRRVYLFDGGCTSIEFDFSAGISAGLANQVSLALSFAPREAVNEAVLVATDGREQLDPLP